LYSISTSNFEQNAYLLYNINNCFLHWMFNTYEHNGVFPVVVIVWDVSTTSHGTVGWDRDLGLGVLCMGQLGIPTVCPLLPMVQWDGMDT